MGEIRDMLDERAVRYGAFPNHATISQSLKSALFSVRPDVSQHLLTNTQQEALEMICHKMARIVNGDPDYRDNWDDIAGYATLVSDELKRVEASDV